MPSTLATTHADALNQKSCKQIARFCELVAKRFNNGMTKDETDRFRAAAAALKAVLAMQSDNQ